MNPTESITTPNRSMFTAGQMDFGSAEYELKELAEGLEKEGERYRVDLSMIAKELRDMAARLPQMSRDYTKIRNRVQKGTVKT